jgi:Resolvase, N terminal domain
MARFLASQPDFLPYRNELIWYNDAMYKRVGLYLRVSTKSGQTVDNQRQALTAAIGRRPGWVIAGEFTDAGVSGAKGRDKRPEFDRLLNAVVRRRSMSSPLGRWIG